MTTIEDTEVAFSMKVKGASLHFHKTSPRIYISIGKYIDTFQGCKGEILFDWNENGELVGILLTLDSLTLYRKILDSLVLLDNKEE